MVPNIADSFNIFISQQFLNLAVNCAGLNEFAVLNVLRDVGKNFLFDSYPFSNFKRDISPYENFHTRIELSGALLYLGRSYTTPDCNRSEVILTLE